jgi:hypothetical protein
VVKKVYAVRIKVDETLPWIELKRAYTYKEARKAAEDFLSSMKLKIITVPEEAKQAKSHAWRRQGVKTRKKVQREVLYPAFSVDESYVCLTERPRQTITKGVQKVE